MTELLFGPVSLQKLFSPADLNGTVLGTVLMLFCIYRLAHHNLGKTFSDKEDV